MEVMHEQVAGLDVHKKIIVACTRRQENGKARRECRTFNTTMAGLQALLAWLSAAGCTHVAVEATGIYWIKAKRLVANINKLGTKLKSNHSKTLHERKKHQRGGSVSV